MVSESEHVASETRGRLLLGAVWTCIFTKEASVIVWFI